MSSRPYDDRGGTRESRDRAVERELDIRPSRYRYEDDYNEERAVDRERSRNHSSREDDTLGKGGSRRSGTDYHSPGDDDHRGRSRHGDEDEYTRTSLSKRSREDKWTHDRYSHRHEEPTYSSREARSSRNADLSSRSGRSTRRSPSPARDDTRRSRRRPETPRYDSAEAREQRPLNPSHTEARSITPSPSPTRTAPMHSDDDSDYGQRRSRSPRRRDDDRQREHRRRHRSESRDSRSPDRHRERRRRSSHGDKDGRRDKERDGERERERRKEKKKSREDREERRSVLTGKKIKLKVHKDADDIERDKKREDLLRFLNQAYD